MHGTVPLSNDDKAVRITTPHQATRLNWTRAISCPAPPAATAATRSDRPACAGASPAASPPTHPA
eukprot:4291218-Prymnesium_polylepis.1